MTDQQNVQNQPIGRAVPGWISRPLPPLTAMTGRFCRVEPLVPATHAADLFEANREDRDGRNWTYLGVDGFSELVSYRAWLDQMAAGADPLFHAIIDLATGRAVGLASYLRIDPANGVIEVGHINYSPRLQQRPAATEAMFLMMRRAFDELGYRRYEWKCDDRNEPSRAAAKRLGFTYEGTFRQALVYKGRNRDTAWFSILDGEWPAVRAAFERWLAPANFEADGRQRQSLAAFRVQPLALADCINQTCPWSGKPVSADSLTLYKGQVVGFCNTGCRDKFEKAVGDFEAALPSPSR
ncbi:MAG: family N-acetyltransferase [Rhodospirillales bacterium]|nr:family N-acetyltransferase [Rhodospirillales bacterium]